MELEDTSATPDDAGTEKADSDEEFLLAKEETALQVYKALWKDFYSWDQHLCRQMLQQLQVEQPANFQFPAREFPPECLVDSDSLNEYTEWFVFECCDEHFEDALPLRLQLQEERLRPYSSFTSCTPSSTNAKNPKIFIEKAPFTPFSDDSEFKKNKYLSLFSSFGWQTEFWDPDREIIFLETARRLHYGHGFSYSEIDNLRIHYVPLRVHGSAGMLWEVSQRDRLLWPGSQMSSLPDLVQQGVPNLNPHESVNQGIMSFCDNLNCLRSACPAHDESHPIIALKPTLTSKDIRTMDVTPCDRDCYLATDAEFELSNLSGTWHEKDLSLFSSVIKFAPDSRPCDLAVICRRPCIEMYIQRRKHFTDDAIEKKETLSIEPHDLKFEEEDLILNPDMVLRNRVKQCYHLGTCNQYSNCSCYNNRQRCERTCRCPKTCNLRFKGCECDGPKSCSEAANCPCRKAGRECDPEVCITCDARNSNGGRALTCRNTALQRNGFPRIWVHPSRFGLGAFAMNRIDAGRCVGDYIGEFIGEDIDVSMIRRFLHRNYAFSLTRTLCLDSYLLGNETRYLNHSKHSNCTARLTMVNGDVKIGIFAGVTIKKAGELLLDYGDNYWQDGESDDGDID